MFMGSGIVLRESYGDGGLGSQVGSIQAEEDFPFSWQEGGDGEGSLSLLIQCDGGSSQGKEAGSIDFHRYRLAGCQLGRACGKFDRSAAAVLQVDFRGSFQAAQAFGDGSLSGKCPVQADAGVAGYCRADG